jgi:hypothetical protein
MKIKESSEIFLELLLMKTREVKQWMKLWIK